MSDWDIGHILIFVAHILVEHIVVLAIDGAEDAEQHGAQYELEGQQREFPHAFAFAIETIGIGQRDARIDVTRQEATAEENDETNDGQNDVSL